MSQHNKKVLFTSHTANFSKFNRPFIRWFKELGYEVHYASAGEEDVLDTDKHFTIPFERSPFKLNNLRAIQQLKKIIDTEHYDIIHTHTPMGSVITRLAAIKARKHGTRVIYTAHGFHFYKGAPVINWIIYYPIEKIMAYFTDTLVTINKEDFERSSRSFKTNVRYVKGVGVDPKIFDVSITNTEKKLLRTSLGLKQTDFVMLYTAELSKRKNQLWLIASLFNLMKDHQDLHILLPGQDSLNNKCQELVTKLGLSKQIHFLGYRKDIPQIMKISDLAISASQQEGLPMNIIEAMYLGLPIVATDCRGNRDLIGNGKGGLIIPQGDNLLLSQKIEELYNSQELRGKLSAEAKIEATPYVLDKIMCNMADIYAVGNSVSQPVRILHVVTSMNRAGLETMIMNYYRNIDRSKVQFDFLMHRTEESDYDKEILKLGGRIYRLPSVSVRHLRSYVKVAQLFFVQHPNYSTVHAHMDALSALPLAAARKAKIPIRIAHSHNNSFDFDIKYPIRMLAKQFIQSRATSLYACSSEAAEFMFGNKSRYKIINNAIKLKDFTYDSSTRLALRKKLNINSQLVVGHIGRFTNQKNQDYLIHVFSELHKKNKNSLLLLVGVGENMLKIRNKIAEMGLESSVRFLGSRSDIGDLMQAMDVFVMPSRYEGLGVVAIEAQAAGLPCLLSDVMSKDLNLTGLCRYASIDAKPEEWAKMIISITKFERLDTSELMSENGYSIEVEVKKLQSLYLGVTNSVQ